MNLVYISSYCDLNKKTSASSIHTLEVFNNLTKYYNTYLLSFSSNLSSIKRTDKLINNKSILLKYKNNIFYKNLLIYIYFPILLILIIIKYNINVFYVRFASPSLPALLISKLFGKKNVIEVNGTKLNEFSLNKENILSTLIYFGIKLYESICYKLSDKIIAVSDGIKEDIIQHYDINENKILVISNGANTKIFLPIKNAKNILNYKDNTFYIGFVGNLAKWQGVHHLIEASKLIIKKNSLDIKFVIVGSGNEENYLKKLVKKYKLDGYYEFVGKINYNRVPLYINAFDLCIAPFIKNRSASPMKIFEYMACSKPILSSDIMDVKNIKDSKKLINFYEASNIEDLKRNILYFIKNYNSLKKISLDSRKTILDYYTWEITANKIYKVINNL